ncbi:MAG: exopolysaccharide biosynthesis protein [Acidobacteria bacterium]|nr:exopolysaccharide biosynthesis protein [Acidobacteriota bacterium]
MGFVDIHSHILYGIDDGAKTMEESLEMLQIAAAAGTTDIVATPHANGRYQFSPTLIEARIAELAAHTGVRIHRGCDFHLQADNIEDAIAHPDKYTINHQAYLLVEFSDLAIFTSSDEILSELVGAGMAPIITHPERNGQLQRRVDDIARWIELGCYVQVTAGSCTGLFGKAAKGCVDALMARGLVHFVASDAHNCEKRSPDLREAHAALTATWGEEHVEPLFVGNPKAVLTGDAIDAGMSPYPVKARKWYQFWS